MHIVQAEWIASRLKARYAPLVSGVDIEVSQDPDGNTKADWVQAEFRSMDFYVSVYDQGGVFVMATGPDAYWSGSWDQLVLELGVK